MSVFQNMLSFIFRLFFFIMTDRYFVNSYSDYQNEQYLQSDNQLIPQVRSSIVRWINDHLHKLERHIDRHSDPSDESVYTGSAGVALLYLRLALIFPDEKEKYQSQAKIYIDRSLNHLHGKRMTFLCGDAGPLGIAAVIYQQLNDEKMVTKCLQKLVTIKSQAFDLSKPDEYLYGRAGYLYALMFIREQLGADLIESQLVTEVFQTMIKSGETYSRQVKSPCPLMYQWHEKEYLGAAHGISGILYLLLKVAHDDAFPHLRPYINSHLLPTIEHLKSKRYPSGNYLSSNESDSDRLVQWCHGAPGFSFLFARTYEFTGQREYLELATAAGDVVWQRGLLRKGYGLCHGTAGNGYVFLNLYRVTHQPIWLHRAVKFADHCLNYGEHDLSRTPDHPYSLFEGLAGTIYFMTDILHPTEARFPAFT